MLSGVNAWPESGMGLPKGQRRIGVREMWEFILERVVMQDGPFSGVRKSEMLDKLVRDAVRLFPCGIPEKNKGWCRPNLSVGNGEYVERVKQVFARTAPTPISNVIVLEDYWGI